MLPAGVGINHSDSEFLSEIAGRVLGTAFHGALPYLQHLSPLFHEVPEPRLGVCDGDGTLRAEGSTVAYSQLLGWLH